MGPCWVGKASGCHGVAVLQINSLSKIRTSGMGTTMDTPKATITMDMPLHKILTCMLMHHIKDMVTINSSSHHPSSHLSDFANMEGKGVHAGKCSRHLSIDC